MAALLAICFTGFMNHGLLPDSMKWNLVIKDKVGSVDNYRPIALASVLSKVLEKILLERLTQYLGTTCNQFGFKAKLRTDLCIYALKEVTHMYMKQNSSIVHGFIDASKAFDRVNHFKLFKKLSQRGAPDRILSYWYAKQRMQVNWSNSVSASFGVMVCVRGGYFHQLYLTFTWMNYPNN